MNTFLGSLALGLKHVLEAVAVAFEDEKSFNRLLRELGWDSQLSATEFATVKGAGGQLPSLVGDLQSQGSQLESGTGDELLLAAQLIATTTSIIGFLQGLQNAHPGGLPGPLGQQAFWDEAPAAMVDHLLMDYLQIQHQVLAAVLVLVGLVDVDAVTPAGAGRLPYERRTFHWERLGQVVSDPAAHVHQVYHWNDGQPFDHARLMASLADLFRAARVPARLSPPDGAIAAGYWGGAPPAAVQQVSIPLAQRRPADLGSVTEFGLVIAPIPPSGQASQPPVGFVIAPLAAGDPSTLPASAVYTLEVGGGFANDRSFGLEIRPSATTLGISAAVVTAHLALKGHPTKPWLIVGGANSHRLEAKELQASITVSGQGASAEAKVEVGAGDPATGGGLALVIDFGDADGFLKKVIGFGKQRIELPSAIAWTNTHGFALAGQSKLSATVPIHQTIADVVTIDSVYLALLAGSDASTTAAIQVAVSGSLAIGPVEARVDRIGVEFDLHSSSGSQAGNVGGLDISLGFKPPNGLGMKIDAGAVVGGGYIYLDPPAGQYAGVLEITIEAISVKAIGVLNTKLPDGTDGFSLIIIITTEFTPIQLGFGFTLNGVGGLAGINRTMILDALRTGLRNKALGSIMFPDNPIRNAAKIISDLSRIFPPSEGRYVFGPMVEIGWGVPTLIKAELGIVLEIPEPIRLAILGRIIASIPTEEAALILFHLDVLGAIDFDKELLSIDATLYDSRLLVFSLSGDMALRLSWGNDSYFALSVGGLHPKFQPPPAFPHLRRLTVSIGVGDNPRLSLESYFAITSNSVQFGADLELYAAFAGFRVHGYLGFDALFIFSPFHFVAEMRAGVEVDFEGLTLLSLALDLLLSGPTPWHAHGTASFDILWWTVSVTVDATWGDPTQVTLPAKAVLPELTKALADARSWHAQLPAQTERAVSLQTPKASSAPQPIRVHPLGRLGVRQGVVPLDVAIQKFGSHTPSDGDYFALTQVTVNTLPEATVDIKDRFARGQFYDLSDADKLSAPAYEPFDAGKWIGSDGADAPGAQSLNLHYETVIIDDVQQPARKAPRYTLLAEVVHALAGQGASALSLVKTSGKAAYVEPGTRSPVSLLEPAFVVASTADLSVASLITSAAGASFSEASVSLQQHIASHPEDVGKFQVIPLHEAVAP